MLWLLLMLSFNIFFYNYSKDLKSIKVFNFLPVNYTTILKHIEIVKSFMN